MKRNRLNLIFLSATILLLIGCKEDKCQTDYLVGELPRVDCFDCEWYAPDSATISSTGYNTVTQLRNYFVCHRETLFDHMGDTLAMTGWLYWGNEEMDQSEPEYMSGNVRGRVYLTDREDHLGKDETIRVFMDPAFQNRFMENYDEMLEKIWKVTGKLQATENYGDSICCRWEPCLLLISLEIDTK